MKITLFTAQVCCGMALLWPTTVFTQAIADSAGDPAAAIRHKLETIVIPRLELHDATLSDAVEQLRAQCRQLDTDPNPNTPGINFFIKMAAPAPGATPGPSHITLTIARVPVLEALGRVAMQVGMKVKIEPFAVSLVPMSEQTEPMMTAAFHLPPEALGFPSEAVPSPAANASVPRRDARDFLKSKGIPFPPGASATYLPSVQKLVVRNTHEYVDTIKTLFPPDISPFIPKSP